MENTSQSESTVTTGQRKKIFIIHGKGRVGGEGEEGGGDLDTIVSNTFYGVWCRGVVREEQGREAIYGKDYEFDFVNYHEGLCHLSKHSGCDVFLPDFPLDAIPDVRGDVEYLKAHDVSLIRMDDHHPWTEEAVAILDELKNEGLLQDYVMAGPRKGEEMPKEAQVCGADLIYRQFVKSRPWDNPGLAELRRLAHVQDLHLDFDDLAISLSKLIGSGHSKIDMVLRLMNINSFDDMKNIMHTTGWDKEVRAYERALRRVVSRLNNNLALAKFLRPPFRGEESDKSPERELRAMEEKLGLLRLVLPLLRLFKEEKRRRIIKKLYAYRKANTVRVLIALAPYRAEGEVRINVASAIEYLKTQVQMHYFFYCYGSFLMTTRNVDDAERFIDLSLFMPFIGSPGDGGHREAASGKPSQNPNFDHEKFDKVSSANFQQYALFLAHKVKEFTDLELLGVVKLGG